MPGPQNDIIIKVMNHRNDTETAIKHQK